MERHGTQRRLRRGTIPYKMYLMIKWLIINVSSLFSQLIKYLLVYIPYKICKHCLINIDFIASVYELFDNPSYILVNKEFRQPKYIDVDNFHFWWKIFNSKAHKEDTKFSINKNAGLHSQCYLFIWRKCLIISLVIL